MLPEGTLEDNTSTGPSWPSGGSNAKADVREDILPLGLGFRLPVGSNARALAQSRARDVASQDVCRRRRGTCGSGWICTGCPWRPNSPVVADVAPAGLAGSSPCHSGSCDVTGVAGEEELLLLLPRGKRLRTVRSTASSVCAAASWLAQLVAHLNSDSCGTSDWIHPCEHLATQALTCRSM